MGSGLVEEGVVCDGNIDDRAARGGDDGLFRPAEVDIAEESEDYRMKKGETETGSRGLADVGEKESKRRYRRRQSKLEAGTRSAQAPTPGLVSLRLDDCQLRPNALDALGACLAHYATRTI